MFAVVANGIQAICRTQRRLDTILAIYPYPKFCKCSTEEEARQWLREHSRSMFTSNIRKYGNTAAKGYASVEYYIWDNAIYYNINTEMLGYIKIESSKDVMVDARRNLLKIKISNVRVNDMSISSHCVAIRRLLKILGTVIDLDITVPDISIYLAATKYTGKSHCIRGLQNDIANRVGAVSFTVSEKVLNG